MGFGPQAGSVSSLARQYEVCVCVCLVCVCVCVRVDTGSENKALVSIIPFPVKG